MQNILARTAKLTAALAGLAVSTGVSYAVSTNITVADPQTINENSTLSSWQHGAEVSPANLTDYGEVEPGMIAAPRWDLAAFIADTSAKTLGVLSGYDLMNGTTAADGGVTTMGDIFIASNPPVPATYPEGTVYPQFIKNGQLINGSQGMSWDFAIKLNWTNSTYTVYQLDANSVLENGEYSNNSAAYNAASMPWRLATAGGNGHGVSNVSGGNYGTAIHTDYFTYTSTLSGSSAASLLGYSQTALDSTFTQTSTNNYKYFVNLQGMGWLGQYQSNVFPDYFHTTMWCGNDDLWGQNSTGYQVTVPDGSQTVVMLGIGLSALATLSFRRRRA
jgi:hypothetical protein